MLGKVCMWIVKLMKVRVSPVNGIVFVPYEWKNCLEEKKVLVLGRFIIKLSKVICRLPHRC